MNSKQSNASGRFSIATLSLGSADSHRLEDKLRAATDAGFQAVELFIPDWEKYLELYLDEKHLSSTPENHLQAARCLRSTLDDLHLRVNCIQPLRNVEGILDPVQRQNKFKQAAAYFPICNALNTDLILCCSNIEPDSSGDISIISKDLVELADMASTWQKEKGGPLLRIGYEGLSWGTHVNTWRQAWTCVNYDPRPNLGLIIDSFNSLAREYADPYTPSGLQRSISLSTTFLQRHLDDLARTVPGDRIFLFQIADATLPEPSSPLSTPPPHDSGIPRLQPWSRNCRLFPLESQRGAFLPVAQYARAVISTGYAGDLSLEVFNASLHNSGSNVPRDHAMRGYAALMKLDKALMDYDNHGFSSAVTSPNVSHDLFSMKLHQAFPHAVVHS